MFIYNKVCNIYIKNKGDNMKLKYLGKGQAQNSEIAKRIVTALSKQGFYVHHKPENNRDFTIFEEEVPSPNEEE